MVAVFIAQKSANDCAVLVATCADLQFWERDLKVDLDATPAPKSTKKCLKLYSEEKHDAYTC
ncbi:hypothetical protein FHS79_003636 [Polymorphobacter multimanifer]|uniref:Uncharacterized protein n=1 Tax=Polymorphobacter multimanifer TaxID=1070431 RepID=A0A841LA73_9SPHN|nr:hypothetical protein [Polymorphobacter multimanifer]